MAGRGLAAVSLAVRNAGERRRKAILNKSPLHLCVSCAHASVNKNGVWCYNLRTRVSLFDSCMFFTPWRDSALLEQSKLND